jgi:cytidylate kinase
VTTNQFSPVVTISATYGTGGSVIAPRIAEALGVPFLDRFLTADLTRKAAQELHSQEGLAHEEQAVTPAGRFLSYFSRAASVGAVVAPDVHVEDDQSIRTQVANGLSDVFNGSPAVILGRAGAVVLAERPRSYHVRLDASAEKRIDFASQFEALDRESAQKRQAEADRARSLFVKRLYRVDPAEPSLYHLIVDTTVLGIDRSVDVILAATRAFVAANP